MMATELKNPLNEEVASTATEADMIDNVDEFEMNQQEKSETLQEYPVNELYDGPEPKPVPNQDKE